MNKVKLGPVQLLVAFSGPRTLPIRVRLKMSIVARFTGKQTGRTYLVGFGFSDVTNRKWDREGAANTAYRDPKTKLYWRRIGK